MKSKLLLSAIVLFLVGCATIPQEAPELSVELGKRISTIEDSHITLLHRFFDQKRKAVDEFIEDEWIPIFSKEFFSNKTISKAWDTIVKEDNKKQRLTFLAKTVPALQKKVNEKRLELIQPLDDLERQIEKKIREEYTQVRAMNNSITSFLLSASKVAENRKLYLEMVGIKDEKIEKLIEQTDDAVTGLLGKARDVKDKANTAEKYLEKIRAIRDSI